MVDLHQGKLIENELMMLKKSVMNGFGRLVKKVLQKH